jgi:hypothetical protein
MQEQGDRARSGFLSRKQAEFLAKIATAIRKGNLMSFGIYSIGFAIVIGGLIYGAYLLHVPAHWIAVGAVVLLGVGIVKGVKTMRQKDPVR